VAIFFIPLFYRLIAWRDPKPRHAAPAVTHGDGHGSASLPAPGE